MNNHKDDTFQQYLLDNANNPEIDVILQKILEDAPSEDEALAAEGFAEMVARTGLKPASTTRDSRNVWLRFAAVLAIPVALLAFWGIRKAAEPAPVWKQESTYFAQTRTVLLPDGTSVTLNACSRLYYPSRFKGKERRIMLAGEALFDVSHDRRKQFVVSAGNMEIKVHGTRFNVSSYPENKEDEIALLEGSVEMSLSEQEGSVFLKPGELVKYDKTEGTLERRHFAINYYEEVLKSDGLQFYNEKFSDIAASLGRKFNLNIVIEDSSLASERFIASFINNEGIEEVLDALNTGGHFKVTRKDNIIYIKR